MSTLPNEVISIAADAYQRAFHNGANSRRRMRAALSALEAAGWVCVPVEATPEMCMAAIARPADNGIALDAWRGVWTAMLTASNPKEKPDV